MNVKTCAESLAKHVPNKQTHVALHCRLTPLRHNELLFRHNRFNILNDDMDHYTKINAFIDGKNPPGWQGIHLPAISDWQKNQNPYQKIPSLSTIETKNELFW